MTNCIKPLADFLTHELGRDDEAGWSKSIYKGTDCGAWLAVDGDTVKVGSIVEGSDVEVGPERLSWPFDRDQFWRMVEGINAEACFYWTRDNSTWFKVMFTPADERPQTEYFGRECWGEVKWDSEDVPNYVKEKVRQFFEKGGDFPEYNKYQGIAVGVEIAEYLNDMTY